MAIANGLSLPNPLSNGTTADAVAVMADYNYLLGALNRALLDSGGGAGVNAQSTQIHNLANGVAANDAVNLSQLGGYALLAGATFTGSVGFTQPVSATSISATSISATSLALSGSATIGNNASASTATPLFVDLGGTFSNAAGANPKLRLFNDGTNVYGFGVSLAQLDYLAPATGSHNFYVGATKFVSISTTGLLTANTGLSSSGPLSLSGALTPGSAANSVGYLGAPSTTKTANYTLALADIGGAVNMNGTGLTLTIPANASVAIPVDTIIVGGNLNASNLTIAITTDTLIWSGTTTTGSRTIGQNGEFRLRKIAATTWLITGTAMS